VGSTSPPAEGVAIVAGLLAASSVRFVLLRGWAYRNHTRALRSSNKVTAERDQTALGSQAA
jgi:hypothetical protein